MKRSENKNTWGPSKIHQIGVGFHGHFLFFFGLAALLEQPKKAFLRFLLNRGDLNEGLGNLPCKELAYNY